VNAIDAYVAELDGALRGPRRAKADLLAEARDSLVDAAEAYDRRGVGRAVAERRAVREFGTVDEIAPEYQTELALAQGRRTALLVFVVVGLQYLISEQAVRSGVFDGPRRPGPGYALLAHTVDWLGIGTILGALLAVLACGVGVRYLGTRRRLVRAVGVFALSAYGFFAVAGMLLTLLNPAARAMLPSFGGVAWVAVFWVVPVGIALSARRCLTAALAVGPVVARFR